MSQAKGKAKINIKIKKLLLIPYRASSSRARNPAQCPEFGAQRWNKVCRMVGFIRSDEVVVAVPILGLGGVAHVCMEGLPEVGAECGL